MTNDLAQVLEMGHCYGTWSREDPDCEKCMLNDICRTVTEKDVYPISFSMVEDGTAMPKQITPFDHLIGRLRDSITIVRDGGSGKSGATESATSVYVFKVDGKEMKVVYVKRSRTVRVVMDNDNLFSSVIRTFGDADDAVDTIMKEIEG